MPDRDHYFLATTLDTGEFTRDNVESWMSTMTRGWHDLVERALIKEVRALWRVSNMELPTEPVPWTLVLLAEVAAGADPGAAWEAQAATFADINLGSTEGMRLLGDDLLCRSAGSNCPLPEPSPVLAARPHGWRPNVVHVEYPAQHRALGEAASRDFHGPVSELLIERGEAFRIVIADVVETKVRHPASPPWNHFSVLEGDWSGGFTAAARTAVDDIAAKAPEVMKLVAEADGYRTSRQACIAEELRVTAVDEE